MSAYYQCIVDLKNQSKITLINLGTFLEHGKCVDTLPQSLGPSGSGSALFKSIPGSGTGSSGVFTYNLKTANGEMMEKKLAVMFDNSRNHCQQNSCFAVGFVAKSRACDDTLYQQMSDDSSGLFVRGKAGQPLSCDGPGVTITATMSESHISIMNVEVWDK